MRGYMRIKREDDRDKHIDKLTGTDKGEEEKEKREGESYTDWQRLMKP